MNYSIVQYGKLNEIQKLETIEIFIDGFGHLMKFTKDRNILKSLFLQGLDPFLIYVLIENETVIGLLGLGTNKMRPVKLNIDTCKEFFGNLRGAIICKQANAIFQSKTVKRDTDLYIDVLATSKQFRGKGVATRLLQYSFDLQGYRNYYLEVFSKNTNAKRLYDKMGFVEYKKTRLSLLSLLSFQGFGYPIKMKKQ